MTMLPQREDLPTKNDLSAVGDELKGEISAVRDELKGEMGGLRLEMADFKSEVRSEIAQTRLEMDLKFATKADLLELRRDFNTSLQSFVRSFIVTQAATVVGVTGIVYGLTRFV